MDSIGVGNLTLNSNVLLASALDGKYDKTGGEVSGDIKILSGNYV